MHLCNFLCAVAPHAWVLSPPPATRCASVIASAALSFSSVPATDVEERLVERLLSDVTTLEPESAWLATLTPWDALRYTRVAINERSGSDEEALLAHARDRLAATARWRIAEKVEGIVERERETYAMPAFFRTHKLSEPKEEARWLSGTDARGRPVALFQVGSPSCSCPRRPPPPARSPSSSPPPHLLSPLTSSPPVASLASSHLSPLSLPG